MAASMLKTAISCVKGLQKDTTEDDDIFKDPQNMALASAMSLLSNTANFIETTVNRCSRLFDIEMLILCRVKSSEHGRNVFENKHFVLWNSLLSLDSSGIGIDASRAGTMRNNHDGVTNAIQDGERQSERINRNVTTVYRERNVRQTGEAVYDNRNGSSMSPTEANNGESSGSNFEVPLPIASECLGLLLDASGFSSHKSSFQQSSYTNVGSKVLVDALRKVLSAESNERKREKRLRSENQSSTSTPHSDSEGPAESDQTDIIYMDLLPDHLRSSAPGTERFVTIPLIKFGRRGNPIVTRRAKVSLNIRKPDRNKKNQNFAVLCTLLHFNGKDGTCSKVLREYAKEGLSTEGCKRRMKFCVGQNSNCGGFENCNSLRKAVCEFVDEKRRKVGTGTVDPFIRDFEGRKIQESEILMRFAQVTENHDTEIRGISQICPNNTLKVLERQWIWKKSMVSRVSLQAEYGVKVGTAILVENQMLHDVRETLLKTIPKKFKNHHGLDVTKAVTVCDVQISRETPNSFRYPYAEWYEMPLLQPLKELHLGKAEVPDVLQNTDFGTVSALLWHKSMCQVIK